MNTPTEQTKSLGQIRSLIRKSYYIPDDYKIPVGRNHDRYLRSYKYRYFKWRYRCMENRRLKLDKLSRQLYFWAYKMEHFVRYNEWCERQMRQYQDLLFILGDGVDEDECPDEFDIDEILQSRANRYNDMLDRHKTQFPDRFLRQNNNIEYMRREWICDKVSEAEQELSRWQNMKRSVFNPAEDRRTDKVLRRYDDCFDMYIKEELYPTSIPYKQLLPDRLHEMWQNNTRNGRFKQVIEKVLCSTPSQAPTLDVMEVNNEKHNERMRMLDETAKNMNT